MEKLQFISQLMMKKKMIEVYLQVMEKMIDNMLLNRGKINTRTLKSKFEIIYEFY